MSNRTAAAVIVAMAFFGACNNGKPVSSKGLKVSKAQTCPATKAQAPSRTLISGVVVETINTSNYTYVSINTGKETVWAAAPTVTLKKGDTVSFDPGMPMENHVSKTLNRTFPLVYFTGGFVGKTEDELSKIKIGMDGAQTAQSPHAGAAATGKFDFSGIVKPANGKTVAELFSQKDALAGKKVVVRGRLVKANYGILGKTWLHLQDGTGKEGSNDIAVTTTDVKPKKGDLVLVEGTLHKDKDIGSGYNFPVIIEDAVVKVEK